MDELHLIPLLDDDLKRELAVHVVAAQDFEHGTARLTGGDARPLALLEESYLYHIAHFSLFCRC